MGNLRRLEANPRTNPLLQLEQIQSDIESIKRRGLHRTEAEARYASRAYVDSQDARMAISQILRLPELRAVWPMSSIDASENVYDLSQQGRLLTNNNGVTFGTTPTTFSVFAEFDGVDQSLSRADESGLDVTAELTAGLWLYLDTWASGDAIMGKDSTSSQRSWRLSLTGTLGSTNAIRAEISSNGTAYGVTLDSKQGVLAVASWYHVVLRYDPSTELALFIDGSKYRETSSIPASLHNSSAAFGIGFTTGATGYLDGRAKLAFLCAALVDDEEVRRLYDQQKALFV